MNVVLSWSEVFRAALSAVAARIRSIRQNTQRGLIRPAWGVAIEHACAELALAKALGRRPVPGTIVRSTWRPAGRLIIREQDHDARAYVLVTGSVPRFRVAGWIRGIDAKTPRFWAIGDGRGGYFVPQSELHTWGASSG